MRKFSDKSTTVNQNTRFTFIDSPPSPENHAIYEEMWNNSVEQEKPQMTE
jgi:hypothetical protein